MAATSNTVTLAELEGMAHYYGVDISDKQEFWLLAAVKEAILAPVVSPWKRATDDDGELFVHCACVPYAHQPGMACAPHSESINQVSGLHRAAAARFLHSTRWTASS
jgi:hypothetical protein